MLIFFFIILSQTIDIYKTATIILQFFFFFLIYKNWISSHPRYTGFFGCHSRREDERIILSYWTRHPTERTWSYLLRSALRELIGVAPRTRTKLRMPKNMQPRVWWNAVPLSSPPASGLGVTFFSSCDGFPSFLEGVWRVWGVGRPCLKWHSGWDCLEDFMVLWFPKSQN